MFAEKSNVTWLPGVLTDVAVAEFEMVSDKKDRTTMELYSEGSALKYKMVDQA